MKVKIKSLSLSNFKGIKALTVEFKDITRIYGDNGTGKTTIVDAFTWLMFGKDSTDRKDFDIKTLDSNNKVIHKLDHEVTGVLDVDGVETVLRRCYREKWVTRRGNETPELQGHETLFFWNDVPMQAGEYQDKIDSIIKESMFKLITSPIYFNNMKWPERRQILISISGDISDKDLATTKEFKDLLTRMEGKTIEEYKKEVAAKKKKLKDELALIPARIDEQARSKPVEQDWKQIQDEIDILNNSIEQVDAEIADESKKYQGVYAQRAERQKQINDLKMKVSNLEFKARQEFQSQLNNKQAHIEQVKNDIQRINLDEGQYNLERKREQEKVRDFQNKVADLRKKWMEINAETLVFNHDLFVCPACQRELEPGDIENKQSLMVQNFNESKARKLAEIRAEGLRYSEEITNIEDQEGKKFWFEAAKNEAAEALKLAESVEIVSVQAILKENEQYNEASKALAELEKQPETEVAEADNRQLKLKRSGYVDRLDILKSALNTKAQIEAADIRITELERLEKSYSQQLADLERVEFTMQQFIKAKVDLLEGKINQMFTAVQFRLFDTQLNGGIVECCDTLINGVPWQSANNAAKINAGIEIINVLSDYYSVYAPIWLDNSESVTDIRKSSSQMIELYVSEKDKTLRIN
jgi:exonuclease SbcC